jgi:hypothetical protein
VSYLNVPQNIATGPANLRKQDEDDEDNDGYSGPNGFEDFNRPIM